MRIDSWFFVTAILDLSLFSLSLSYFGMLRFLGALLESVAYLEIWIKKEKEEQEITRGHRDQQIQWVLLAGTELHVCFSH